MLGKPQVPCGQGVLPPHCLQVPHIYVIASCHGESYARVAIDERLLIIVDLRNLECPVASVVTSGCMTAPIGIHI